ncbi:hypothetical protein [Vibrio aestuarianus]|uniref:hypothetical protein n=1 Tax=Vibrio aestuarianus TaxID=28171 RepID=UPI003BB51A73
MKKILMLVLLLLGLAGAGAGYYFLYFIPQQELLNVLPDEEPKKPIVEAVAELPPPLKPELTDFYVNSPKLGVREKAESEAFVERVLYRGDKVKILEKIDGWGRITDYFVYEDGGPEVAEWIPMDGLVEQPPVITKQERRATLTEYVSKSDDFKLHEEVFLMKTDELIKEKICAPHDFEELGGWVKSVKYQYREVYFVYCGGQKLANKIYLDVQSKQIFY